MLVSEFLDKYWGACEEGKEDARKYVEMADWWEATERSDYLVWVADKMGMYLRPVAHLATPCVFCLEEDRIVVHMRRDVADLVRELLSNPFKG